MLPALGGAEHRYSDVDPLRLRFGLVDRPIALSLRKIGRQPMSTPTGSERIDCAVHGTNLAREALLSLQFSRRKAGGRFLSVPRPCAPGYRRYPGIVSIVIHLLAIRYSPLAIRSFN